jgi:hypothetical protein
MIHSDNLSNIFTRERLRYAYLDLLECLPITASGKCIARSFPLKNNANCLAEPIESALEIVAEVN